MSFSLSFLRVFHFFYFLKTYLFLAVLGLRCCAQAFSSCGEWGLLSTVGHRLWGTRAQQLWFTGFSSCGSRALEHGSAVVVSRLSCSVTCGVFPDQGLNPHTMYWQVDSLPLDNQGSSPPPLFYVEV